MYLSCIVFFRSFLLSLLLLLFLSSLLFLSYLEKYCTHNLLPFFFFKSFSRAEISKLAREKNILYQTNVMDADILPKVWMFASSTYAIINLYPIIVFEFCVFLPQYKPNTRTKSVYDRSLDSTIIPYRNNVRVA